MKKWIFIVAFVLFTLLVLNQYEQSVAMVESLSRASRPALRIQASIPDWSMPKKREGAVIEDSHPILGTSPMDAAENFIKLHREEFQIQSYHDVRPQLYENPIGTRVKYVVYQDGLPLVGLEIRIRLGRDLSLQEVENEYRPVLKADISQSVLSPGQAVDRLGPLYSTTGDGLNHASSVLFVEKSSSQEPQLAYVVKLVEKGSKSKTVQVVLRASDGQLLSKIYARSEF